MVAVYAVCTILGIVGIVGWITLGMAASALDNKPHLDPEVRFGETGRFVVAGVAGLGLAGMSASFAGWNTGLALLGAIAGAAAAVLSARYLGFEDDSDGDPV